METSKLFSPAGNYIGKEDMYQTLFDEDWNFIDPPFLDNLRVSEYPSNSTLVRLHYAQAAASAVSNPYGTMTFFQNM